MTKTRVRKPFLRNQDGKGKQSELQSMVQDEQTLSCSSLTTEVETITYPDEHAWEKKSTKARKAVVNKLPSKVAHPSNLAVRTATGAIYILLTVVCVLVSDFTTALYLSLLSAICANEFYYMLRADAKLPNELLGVCAAALFPLVMWLFDISGVCIALAVYILVLLVWYVFWQPARISDVSVSLFGAVYTGLIMSTALLLRQSLPEPWGAVLVLGLFVSVWGSDAFAYLVGSAIGKHKLAPHISPNKSWEGFIAGLIFAMAIWYLLSYIPGVSLTLLQALVFGLINGLAGVLGDLVESRIKRNSGFKDSGTIMPGHGGLLDRCDSQFLVTLSGAILLVLGGCIPYVF